jgi:hypothetical protein
MNPGKTAFRPIPMFPIAPTVPIVLIRKAWNTWILFQNPTRLFNSRSQKGKNTGMPELLSTFYFPLFPFSFKRVQPCQWF